MMMTFDEDKQYTYNGIGVVLCGWSQEWVEEWVEDEECSDGGYWDHDVILSDTIMNIRYVGDDTIFPVDVAYLTELEEGYSICSCGMVGCWASGTDYE